MASSSSKFDLDKVKEYLKFFMNPLNVKIVDKTVDEALEGVKKLLSHSTDATTTYIGKAADTLEDNIRSNSALGPALANIMCKVIESFEGSAMNSIRDTEEAMKALVILAEEVANSFRSGEVTSELLDAMGDATATLIVAVESWSNMPVNAVARLIYTTINEYVKKCSPTDERIILIINVLKAVVLALEAVTDHDAALKTAAANFKTRFEELTDEATNASDDLLESIKITVNERANDIKPDDPGILALCWASQLLHIVGTEYPNDVLLNDAVREVKMAVVDFQGAFEN